MFSEFQTLSRSSPNNFFSYITILSNGEYELVADIQTWKDPVPPKRFVEKVTQQYARMTVHNQIKEMGFQVEEEWEMDDNSIELTVTRWNS